LGEIVSDIGDQAADLAAIKIASRAKVVAVS
jgi:hypothetical protein